MSDLRVTESPAQPHTLDTLWVALAAAVLSVTAFFVYYRAGDILLYGDAVAHINIARRVFDSRTPGLLQLGTVWLPLPHVLMMPLVANHWLWMSGVGGSIPSMLSYVFGVVGIFRLARALLNSAGTEASAARLAAFAAAAIYALNPNLLYLQATAMTESLYLALFVWCAVYLQEFLSLTRGRLSAAGPPARRVLWKSIFCAAAASLTRYDGWFLSATLGAIITILWLRERAPRSALPLFARVAILLASVPALWLAYNAIVYRNPFEFANGPYSAKAIERKTSQQGAPPHPGTDNLPLAALYFVRSAEINIAEGRFGGGWLLLAVAATVGIAGRRRRLATAALLWSPVGFYALSVAYGGVPIFMPVWYPFSAYNVRYGLQLLPAFAVVLPIAVLFLARRLPNASIQRIAVVTVAILIGWSYLGIWRAQPVCYREAWINSRTRLALESQLATQLAQLPPDSALLMYLGNHVGALQQAGIPLRRSVNEGNHRVWMQPKDPEGVWERSLANPGRFVDFVVAMDGDPVAEAMRTQSLPVLLRVGVEGQPHATIYRAR